MEVPKKILESHEAVTIYTDLVDSHIYLCRCVSVLLPKINI